MERLSFITQFNIEHFLEKCLKSYLAVSYMLMINVLIFKMRKYVSLKILMSIYFAIFDAYLSHCFLVWAQNCSINQRIVILQKGC